MVAFECRAFTAFASGVLSVKRQFDVCTLRHTRCTLHMPAHSSCKHSSCLLGIANKCANSFDVSPVSNVAVYCALIALNSFRLLFTFRLDVVDTIHIDFNRITHIFAERKRVKCSSFHLSQVYFRE